jgi:hypothetical protein
MDSPSTAGQMNTEKIVVEEPPDLKVGRRAAGPEGPAIHL